MASKVNSATSTDSYDVAVIGYGPTGATAANLLGQQGLKVVVIERDPDIYGRARAISTDDEVMRIWQSVGLADRLQQDMLPNRPLNFVDADGVTFLDFKVAPRGTGHPPQQFIYQPAVDHVLREGVDRFPDVEILLEHECLRVLAKGDGVELLLGDLRTDTFRRVLASYVIAAEGGGSPTRGQLGIGYAGRTYSERWVVIDTKVLTEWDEHDRLRFHCDPVQPTVDCPTPLGYHRWEYPADPDKDDQTLLDRDEIWKILRGQGITPDNVEIVRAVIYSHHVRVAERWRVGRVFLAGDAAHAMPPWIGQGMSAGVRDAANLCWKLAAVVNDQAPESLLDSYMTERRPHVTEITRRACNAGRIITERRPLVATIRNHVLRTITRVPLVLETLLKFLWVPEARYDDGFLAAARDGHRRHRHRAVGWQIPQPWVSGSAGVKARLDDVIGARWAVLHTGTPPAGAQAWASLEVPLIRVTDPALTTWLQRRNAAAVVLRPDKFIYAAAEPGRRLPAPPAGYTGNATTTRPSTTAGVPA